MLRLSTKCKLLDLSFYLSFNRITKIFPMEHTLEIISLISPLKEIINFLVVETTPICNLDKSKSLDLA